MAIGRNLLIVLTHGMRSDVLSDSKVWPLVTHNFEKLAARGLRLIASSACTADDGGMVSLLTGLHARQHGYTDSQHVRQCDGWLAELKQAGYHTAGVGCLHPVARWLDKEVLVDPVDVVESDRCAYFAAMRAKHQLPAVQLQRRSRLRSGPFEPDRLLLEPDDDIDGFIGLQAYHMIDRMPTDKPWALVVCFSGPGNDLPPPSLYDQVVELDQVTHSFIPADLTAIDALCELDYPRVMLQRLDKHRVAQIRCDYLGRVSLIDFCLGRLLGRVRDRSDASKTWTVTSSDRGQLLGEHGLVGHRSFLSPAIEVPVIVAPPTPVKELTTEGLLSSVDVAATILDLAGCDVDSHLAGRSLLPMFRGETFASPSSEACLCEFGQRLMLETKRYKTVFDTNSLGAIGLYDLLNDPYERDNLIDSPVGRNLLDSLRWRLGDVLMPLRNTPGGGV